VFNTGEEFFALENRCPHMGAPLSEGEIVDNCVCCHDHGWIIDLDTGEVVDREGEMAATSPSSSATARSTCSSPDRRRAQAPPKKAREPIEDRPSLVLSSGVTLS